MLKSAPIFTSFTAPRLPHLAALTTLTQTASSWPAGASAFVVQNPPFHHQVHRHDQRRASRTGGAASSGLSSFSPRERNAQRQPPAATSVALGAVASVSSGSNCRRHNTADMHMAATRGAGCRSGDWRWWASSLAGSSSSLLVMRGAGEGGAEAEGGAKRDRSAEAEAESGLRLFNTEGRTKQPFRPQDRRQACMTVQRLY